MFTQIEFVQFMPARVISKKINLFKRFLLDKNLNNDAGKARIFTVVKQLGSRVGSEKRCDNEKVR